MNLRFVAAALAASLGLPAVAPAFDVRTVAFTNQPAPGTPAGVVFSNLTYSTISENGLVAFNGAVKGPGVTIPASSRGIWGESPIGLRKIVRGGDPAVGLPVGVHFGLQSGVKLDGQGRAYFVADAPGPSASGVYSEGQGSLRLVALEGTQAPGLPAGQNFNRPNVPFANDVGQIAFSSFITRPGSSALLESVWTDRDGVLKRVITEGDPAPGIPGVDVLQANITGFNDLGVIAISGRFTGSVYTSDHAIWTESGGAFTLIAKSGQAPAGAPLGAVFSRVMGPQINNAEQLMFYGELTGPGIDAASNAALWRYQAGDIGLIAREGAAAPGVSTGVNYAGFHNTMFNGAGESTFVASLTGEGGTPQNDTGIWS